LLQSWHLITNGIINTKYSRTVTIIKAYACRVCKASSTLATIVAVSASMWTRLKWPANRVLSTHYTALWK